MHGSGWNQYESEMKLVQKLRHQKIPIATYPMKLKGNDLISKKTLDYKKSKNSVFLGYMRSVPQTMIPEREKWVENHLLSAFLEYILITTMLLL